MKRMMIARPGFKIVGADYAALELRISALLAGQEDLIDAFNHDADIHARHASWFFPKEWEEAEKAGDGALIKQLRSKGKPVTFGKIYRAGEHTLYEQIREERLDVRTRNQHRMLLREVGHMSRVLDQKYPMLVKSAQMFQAKAASQMFLKTHLLGRMRRWPMAFIPPGVSLNEACNHPIQGLAADIMNAATLRLVDELKARGWYLNEAFIILQIHDALYLEAREKIAEEVAKVLEECMTTQITYESPITGKENTMHFPASASISRNVKDAA
jgi:DNA polymerase-1